MGLADRLFRFIGTSAVLHLLLLPLTYWLYARFMVPGAIQRGHPLPWWLWPTASLYVALPVVLGRATGVGIGRGARWAAWIAGGRPAPRAWDHLFGQAGLAGWVVLRLKDGTWLAGSYGGVSRTGVRSHASRYPEPQDLYLGETVDVDAEGRLRRGPDGRLRARGRGVLLRWDEVSYLRYSPDNRTLDMRRAR